MKIKIAMVGGGSYSWTYGLYSTFLNNPFFDRETELCLYDINEKALIDLYTYCSYYNDRYPEQAIAITDAPDASGVLPAYGVTVQTPDVQLNMEITRQGGKVLWMMPETASFPMTQRPSACESAALTFLKKRGFGQAEAVHRQLYDGLCVISCAPVQEDVLLYPDLLTVQVRMDTLQVVGLEARSYWTNHVRRTLPEPALSADEAAALLSSQAKVQAHRLCLIPEERREALCWQFTVTRGGETYLIYLDAQDGREVAIRKVIPLENGSTAA